LPVPGLEPIAGPHDSAGPPHSLPAPAPDTRKASHAAPRPDPHARPVFAALDLGTNNCRLLVARPAAAGFRVIDAFSRIVRLGEGVSATGILSDEAMDRAVAALKICADKMRRRGVTASRQIATEACRAAANAHAFIARVRHEVGLELEVIPPAEEAELAVAGCVPLFDPRRRFALVFDIGGGSTEVMWLALNGGGPPRLRAWTSLPCGVVTLAERHAGAETPAHYDAAVEDVASRLVRLRESLDLHPSDVAAAQVVGTSGTVTTLAGVHLGLPRYDRARVDGVWLERDAIEAVTRALRGMDVAERAAHPCIGHDRADLVVAGCAILDGIHRMWPHRRLQVADRGLREGMLMRLIAAERARGASAGNGHGRSS
jgi:exopolyphosphatase/guanosine-5'-triphosphate,3'-diphosphate pyrophosphatase